MRTAVLSALLLAGCAPMSPPPTASEATACSGEAAASLIGQPATSALAAKALSVTGARTIRWTRPGQPVTMDYRPDRLNIELDAENRMQRFRCG